MANELSVHSDDRGAYRTMTAQVNDHTSSNLDSFATFQLRLDDMRVSVYLSPGDLRDLAGALERAAEELRDVSERYEARKRSSFAPVGAA